MSKKLPGQIEAQARVAEAYDKSFEPKPTDPAAPASPAPSTPESPTPAAPAAPVAPAPAAPAPASPAVAAPSPELAENFAKLQRQHQTLQGMYRSLTERFEASQRDVAELKARVDARPPEPPSKAGTPTGPLVTKADEESFGADLVDMARRVAAEEFGKREAGYKETIARLEAALNGTTQAVENVRAHVEKTAHEKFFDGLDERYGNWEGIQASPECQQWLGRHVPGTDILWNDVLVAAAQNANLEKAVEVFDAFLEAHPQMRKPASPTIVAPPAPTVPPAAPPASPLEAEVAPARVPGGGGPPVQPAKRVYKAKEYEDESMRIVRLNQAHRYDDALALQRELDAALAEGRIVP